MSQVYHVFCAYRKVPNSLQLETSNCIIMDNVHLSFLYSPTLANRPQFIVSNIK